MGLLLKGEIPEREGRCALDERYEVWGVNLMHVR